MSNKDVIARLRAEADALEAADKAFNEMPEEHQMAVTLHKLLCRHNHVDGCGWDYEYLQRPSGWNGPAAVDWRGYAHKKYLEKGIEIKEFCDKHKMTFNDALELIKKIQHL